MNVFCLPCQVLGYFIILAFVQFGILWNFQDKLNNCDITIHSSTKDVIQPKDPTHFLSLIIPVRNRSDQEDFLVGYMDKFLQEYLKSKFEILVISQEDDKVFNAAKLMNIGIKYASKNADYFVFQDVNLIPSFTVDYSFPLYEVEHMSWQTVGFPLPSEYFGGVIKASRNSIEKINGYGNNHWGPGVEDNEFRERFKMHGFFDGTPAPFPHSKSGVFGHVQAPKHPVFHWYEWAKKTEIRNFNLIDFQTDGLSQLKDYTILRKNRTTANRRRIVVRFDSGILQIEQDELDRIELDRIEKMKDSESSN